MLYDCDRNKIHLNMKTKRRDFKKLASESRYEIMSAHGFRKRFNTIVKMRSDVNINLAERLLGHSRTIKLDNNYFRPTVVQLFTEYLKALPDLMVDEKYKLYCEDIDLCLKLRKNNWDLMTCCNSYIIHKCGKSRFKSKMNTNVPQSRKLLFSKWGDDLNKYNLK